MKVTYLLLLNLILLFSNCTAQHSEPKGYSLKKEYGLQGAVKEVSTYLCKVSKKVIPTDTSNFFGKYKLTFDRQGNGVVNYRKRKNDNGMVIIYEMIYTGQGKNITYKEHISIDGKETEVTEYKYVWLDDLNYNIVNQSDTTQAQMVTTDQNYRIVKSQSKQGDIVGTNNYKYFIKNNRIEKTVTLNERKENEVVKSVEVMVMKDFDAHNNPTKIYFYNNLAEKNPETVIFKQYKYY